MEIWLSGTQYFYITSTAATPPSGTYINIEDSNETYSITITLSNSQSIPTNFTNDSIHKDYYIIKGGNDLDEKIPLIINVSVDTNQFEGIFKLCNQGSLFTDSMLQDPYCLLLQALIIDSNLYNSLRILVDGVTKITLTHDGRYPSTFKIFNSVEFELNGKHEIFLLNKTLSFTGQPTFNIYDTNGLYPYNFDASTVEDTFKIQASNMTCTKSTSSNCLSSTDIFTAGSGHYYKLKNKGILGTADTPWEALHGEYTDLNLPSWKPYPEVNSGFIESERYISFHVDARQIGQTNAFDGGFNVVTRQGQLVEWNGATHAASNNNTQNYSWTGWPQSGGNELDKNQYKYAFLPNLQTGDKITIGVNNPPDVIVYVKAIFTQFGKNGLSGDYYQFYQDAACTIVKTISEFVQGVIYTFDLSHSSMADNDFVITIGYSHTSNIAKDLVKIVYHKVQLVQHFFCTTK